MAATQNPRQVVKELLQGKAPARPLFLPIVFAMGARVAGVPLREYLSNPTKITAALRQVRAQLPADGVTCYFDPYLEAEALGGTLTWLNDDAPPEVHWPGASAEGEVAQGIRSAEDAARGGRVPVAAEVVRRMKDALRESALLAVGLRGPVALARMLAGGSGPELRDIAPAAIELAGGAVAAIARTVLEAGANVVMICEENCPGALPGMLEEGISRLSVAINIIRFYEALPVVIGGPAAACGAASPLGLEAVGCIELPRVFYEGAGIGLSPPQGPRGLALPADIFSESPEGYARMEPGLHLAIGASEAALVTTADDIFPASDMKRLERLAAAIQKLPERPRERPEEGGKE